MNTLHELALGLAKTYLSSEKKLLNVLIEMREQKSFASLGYTGIFSYCVHALGFSESQASYFSSVARKSEEVPELKKAIDSDELTLSKARRIVSVITPETQQVWIDLARTLPQRELEKRVAEVNPSAVREKIKAVDHDRHEVRLGLSGKAREKLERAIALISKKRGKVSSLEETLESLLDEYLEKNDPVKKAERTILRKVTPTKNRRKIPTAIRHAVKRRDRGRCQEKGCTNQTWTEIHHKTPYSENGAHTLSNLVTLCTAHHKVEHANGHCFPREFRLQTLRGHGTER